MKKRPFRDYYQYIKSSEWKNKRDWFIKHFGDKCFGCGGKGYILHHRHYNNLGTEPPHQLVLLCKNCNDFVHGITQGKFTHKHREMKINLRKLLRKHRSPITTAVPLGQRNTIAI